MRVLGLALAGALVLTARLGSRLVRWDQDGARRCGSGARHCVSMGWQWSELASGVYWVAQWMAPGTPSLAAVNGGWVSRHLVPNGSPGGWVCCPGPWVPTYWVLGPSGGAFDYPFADWRGPTGGWGNP